MSKCVLVPILSGSFEVNKQFVHKWLEEHIPEWSNFRVQSSAEYLGFFIGPLAGTLS